MSFLPYFFLPFDVFAGHGLPLKCANLLLLFYSWGQNSKAHPFKLLHLELQLILYHKLPNLMQVGFLDGHIIFLVYVVESSHIYSK